MCIKLLTQYFFFCFFGFSFFYIFPSQGVFIEELTDSHSQQILQRKEDPTSDHRLHPGKGPTLWKQENALTCTYTYFGRTYQFQYPEYLEISSTLPALPHEVDAATLGMHSYMYGRMRHPLNAGISIEARLFEDGSPVLTLEGVRRHNSLHLSFDIARANYYPGIFHLLLNQAQNTAAEYEIGMLYIHFPNKTNMLLTPPFLKILHLLGYEYLEDIHVLRNGVKSSVFYKNVFSNKETPKNVNNVFITASWTPAPLSRFPIFGIFLKDDTEEILGGVTGLLHDDAFFPYGSMMSGWLRTEDDPRMRKKLIRQAECFLLQTGCKTAEVQDLDDRFAVLYNFLGYIPFVDFLDSFRGNDPHSLTLYRKPLHQTAY